MTRWPVTDGAPLNVRYVKRQSTAVCVDCDDWRDGSFGTEGSDLAGLRNRSKEHAAAKGHRVCITLHQDIWLEPKPQEAHA